MIIRNINKFNGLNLVGIKINNLRYADDSALTAKSETSLQAILGKITEVKQKNGLDLNIKETEYMVTTQRLEPPTCPLQSKGVNVKQIDALKYLGYSFSSNGNSRIAMAKDIFCQMK